MTRHFLLACAALFAIPFALATHTAYACSCMPPSPAILSPSRLIKAPLNARVRIVLPTYITGSLSFRKHNGGEVPAKRIDSPLQSSIHIELVPTQPLEADTRYDVALIRPDVHPSTLVFGTFVTGNAADTQAPIAPKIVKTIVNGHRVSAMSSCSVNTPSVEVFLNGASDPDRPEAHLLHAVWTSNARGVFDIKGPPTAYVVENKGKLQLGKTSSCDDDDFPLPRQGNVKLAIATVDEAGNRSPIQHVSFFVTKPYAGNP